MIMTWMCRCSPLTRTRSRLCLPLVPCPISKAMAVRTSSIQLTSALVDQTHHSSLRKRSLTFNQGIILVGVLCGVLSVVIFLVLWFTHRQARKATAAARAELMAQRQNAASAGATAGTQLDVPKVRITSDTGSSRTALTEK